MSKNEFICDCNVIHQDVVDKITSEMKDLAEGQIRELQKEIKS